MCADRETQADLLRTALPRTSCKLRECRCCLTLYVSNTMRLHERTTSVVGGYADPVMSDEELSCRRMQSFACTKLVGHSSLTLWVVNVGTLAGLVSRCPSIRSTLMFETSLCRGRSDFDLCQCPRRTSGGQQSHRWFPDFPQLISHTVAGQ